MNRKMTQRLCEEGIKNAPRTTIRVEIACHMHFRRCLPLASIRLSVSGPWMLPRSHPRFSGPSGETRCRRQKLTRRPCSFPVEEGTRCAGLSRRCRSLVASPSDRRHSHRESGEPADQHRMLHECRQAQLACRRGAREDDDRAWPR